MINNDLVSEKKIVAIYTRVSTTDQAREGYSLEEQERRLRAKCESEGYDVYKVYTDSGISGKSTENRPAYQQMLKDMRKGKFNMIMAFKLDRISRSIADFEKFFNEIKEYKCGIDLLTDKIDTTGAAGMFFARILAVFAQFEREIIQERTLIGVEGAVNKGHFGGKPPLGYHSKIDVDNNKLKQWEINEEEAKIVREIFELCSMGKTYFEISKILKEKYPKIISRIKIDKDTNEKHIVYRQWNDASISTIINNKSYIGIYEHRKTVKDKDTEEKVGLVPPIITEELFNNCQDMIFRNARNYYRSKKYLFMQVLKCPKCNRILACNGTKKKNGEEYLYYKCKDCGIYIREETIEEALKKKLSDLLELSNLLCEDHLIIDKETAKDIENCRLDHSLRYSVDEKLINLKLQYFKDFNFDSIWDTSDYETKYKFIHTYIDSISIKQYTNTHNKIKSVEIVDLKIKSNKISQLVNYASTGEMDEIIGNSVCQTSYTTMKNEKDALEYINLLKKKYDITYCETLESRKSDIDMLWEDGLVLTPLMFKIIRIRPKNLVEDFKTYILSIKPKLA